MICADYEARLKKTEADKIGKGANWYRRTRSNINFRAKEHAKSAHPNIEIFKQEIQQKQIRLNQIIAESRDKIVEDREKRRREEKEEEQRKREEEEEFKRKEARRIRVTQEECDKQERWRREWEANEEQRRRDFNPEYEERRWMQRFGHCK